MVRRIERQTQIEGWDQGKLDDALVVNIGDGLAARYASLFASCLEFGRTLVASDERRHGNQCFMGQDIKRGPVAPQIAEIVGNLNSAVDVGGYYGPIRSEMFYSFLKYNADAFFHSGNDWNEKAWVISRLERQPRQRRESHDKRDQHFVLSAGNEHELRVAYHHDGLIEGNHVMPQFEGQKQGTITSIASAAMGLAEIVGRTMGLGETLDDVITWNLWSNKRTSHISDFDWSDFNPEGLKIGVVGLGAAGTGYVEAIHNLRFGTVHLYDFDKVEFTNYSRAPHFVGTRGRLKSHVLRDHFTARGGTTKYISRNLRFDENSKIPEVDLLISCVDGYDNQMRLINYSQKTGTPLLLGGCTPFSASAFAYVPGETSSLLHQFDFLKQAYLDVLRTDHPSCNDPEANGSQMLMTVLCAAILAGETVNFFSGNPLKGPFMYHMLENPRLGYIPIAGGRDVGRDVPDFTPLPIDAVTRHVVDGREDITVYGQPFERWYSDTGNILNKPRTKEGS